MSSHSAKFLVMPAASLTRPEERKLSPAFNRELKRHKHIITYLVRAQEAADDSTAEAQTHAMLRGIQTMSSLNALAEAAQQAGYLSEEDRARLAVIGHTLPEQLAGYVDRTAAEIDYRLEQAMNAEVKPGFWNEVAAWLEGN